MKKYKKAIVLVLSAGAFFTSCEHVDMHTEEIVVIANRADESISFIDAKTDVVIEELVIPGSEPMYAVYVDESDKLYVGDRAHNEVHVVNPDTKTVEMSIGVGAGIFHMWADEFGTQLWVNNELDKTISVIDLSTNTVVETISLRAKPHDVFIKTSGDLAYISILSETDAPDSIYLYSTSTFEKLGAVAVGKDPHLFHVQSDYGNRLFVPCQATGEVYILNGSDLSEISVGSLEGVHGIFHASNGLVYLTNISGSQLYAIDDLDGSLVGGPITTPFPVPHNAVANFNGDKLYITHSGGSSNKVSIYNIDDAGSIVLDNTIDVGLNPFGLTYYARWID